MRFASGPKAAMRSRSPPARDNLIWQTAESVAQAQGMQMPPIELEIRNDIPIGKGMGSSAAALTAGVVIADELLGLRWKPLRILDEAARLEGHPDNVAPCTLGSIVASAIDSGGVVRSVRLRSPAAFRRGHRGARFRSADHQGTRRAAHLLQQGGRRLQPAARLAADRRPGYRLHLGIPRGTGRPLPPALPRSVSPRPGRHSETPRPGLLGCALSGAGPSILVFFERGHEAVCHLVRQIFEMHGHGSDVLLAEIAENGFEVTRA